MLPEQSIAELNKIPSLIQHYNHHKTEHAEVISFVDFLALHYGNSTHNKEEDHGDLPFFDSLCTCLLFVHTVQQQVYFASTFIVPLVSFELSNNYHLLHHESIFQPPKA
jgi:hypothetical protein